MLWLGKKKSVPAIFFSSPCEVVFGLFLFSHLQRGVFVAISRTYLISSSLAKSMTTLAFGFSLSRRMTLSYSVCLGSRGILTDWEMHTPPTHTEVNSLLIKNLKKLQEKKSNKQTNHAQVIHVKDEVLLCCEVVL